MRARDSLGSGCRDTGCSGLPPLASHTSSLPFLPTLVTALVLGGLGFLCQSPVPPELTKATPVLAAALDRFEPLPPVASARPLPGLVAFSQQYPLAIAGAGPSGRAARVAGNSRRRCGTGSCEAPKPETVRSAAHPWRSPEPIAPAAAPMPVREAERAWPFPTLPDDVVPSALPFAPTAAALIDDVRTVGARAVTLGSAAASTLAVFE